MEFVSINNPSFLTIYLNNYTELSRESFVNFLFKNISIEWSNCMALTEIIDFLRYLDTELYNVINVYGYYTYLFLFLIVYCKTGFVLLTFLPGDSILFASGTLAANNQLLFTLLFIVFFVSSSIADSQNYFIGRALKKMPSIKNFLMKYFPDNAIERAHYFLESYDRIAITFSRFVPLMRTLTPFISGYTGYPYRQFVRYNIAGSFIWTCIWLGTGYVLGNISWVANNVIFTLVIITVCVLIPTTLAYIKQIKRQKELSCK